MGQWALDCVEGALLGWDTHSFWLSRYRIEFRKTFRSWKKLICSKNRGHWSLLRLHMFQCRFVRGVEDYAPQCSQKSYDAYDCLMIEDVYSNDVQSINLSWTRAQSFFAGHLDFVHDHWCRRFLCKQDGSVNSCHSPGHICWTQKWLAHGCIKPESKRHTVGLMQNTNPARPPPVPS